MTINQLFYSRYGCSFLNNLILQDLNKCLKQLGFCYGANRRVPNPVQFYVTSFDGTAKEEMEKNEGYTNWDVCFFFNFICIFEVRPTKN